MTDFIIVGRGLAAATLAHTFYEHNITFKIIGDDQLSSCSKAAAGVWNPVVFKRLTKSWLADELVPFLLKFYAGCEERLQKTLITQRPILKPFTEEQEKKLWQKKADGELENFLDPEIHQQAGEDLQYLLISNGYGRVEHCGNLDVRAFLEATSQFFKDVLFDQVFDHSQLRIDADKVMYKQLEARNVIFCEGFLVKDNPLFHWIPLKPAKGEILTVNAKGLKMRSAIFNRDGFLMDLSEDAFRVGATYAWDDLSQEPTEKGLAELRSKMEHMAACPYTVLKHEAGIRPSSLDRRPIIGPHPLHRNAFVFNGLGTKGVMLAPFFAKNYVHFYLQNEPLNTEVDIRRFYKLYGKEN